MMTPSTALSFAPPLHFGGETATAAACKARQKPEILTRLAKKDDTPYIGQIPTALLAASGLSEAAFCKRLDRAASHILRCNLAFSPAPFPGTEYQSQNRKRYGTQQIYPKLQDKIATRLGKAPKPPTQTPIRLNYLNSGGVGHAFFLTCGEQTYVFKVSNFIAGDIANGLYLTALGTSDIPQHYAGNPIKKWALLEYIPAGLTLRGRPGKRLKEHGFKLSDNYPGNHIGPFTIDLEALWPTDRKSWIS